MGKRLIQQARGKGSLRYRSPGFNYEGKIGYAGIKENAIGEVMDILNCAGHSAPLMRIKLEDSKEFLLPASLGARKGAIVQFGHNASPNLGNTLPLGNIPSGTNVYNLEVQPFDGGKLVRTSGTSAQVIGREGNEVVVNMPSKQQKKFSINCRATIGIVAGGARVEKPFIRSGKKHIARRRRGKLHPVVSGVAMNAVDHKFGGTHRRSLGVSTTTSRNAPPGRKVGLLAARKSGRGK